MLKQFPLGTNQHSQYLQVALQAVVEAADAIKVIYHQDFETVRKSDGSPVTIADLASNTIIERHLESTGLPILTEETEQARYVERKNWEAYWCVDPLDGTKEFIKRNDQFAINIALIANNEPVLGIIADPMLERILIGGRTIAPAILTFETILFPDKWLPLNVTECVNDPIVITSSNAPQTEKAIHFVDHLNTQFGEIQNIHRGSALKFFDLATGKADVYPRFAPTMEWDIAAGQAIIEALGGVVLHADQKTPLTYNKLNLTNPHFVAMTNAFKNTYEVVG